MSQTALRPALQSHGGPPVHPRPSTVRADPASKTTLTVGDVQRFLGKSKRAFYLLRCDATQGFPAPFVIQGRDHWLMRDLLAWIEARRRSDAIPGRVARHSA
jgi:hypothetical protein